jgi:VCBS repeat-containing protein
MPVDERQGQLANENSKRGLAGRAGGRLEISAADNKDYEPQTALGDIFNPDWNIAAATGANEVQTLRVQDGTGGTFTISFAGQTTAAIAHNATADAVEDALNALSNVTPGDIEVSKTGTLADHTYTLKFGGQFARENVAAITVDTTNVTGTETATVATTTAGAAS